jgi:hypothetical protein
MEIGSNKYLFVLNQAKLNGKGHVVFKVSTEEIKSSDKKMLKLPRGHHEGVRFDIDGGACYCPQICEDASGSCTCYQSQQYMGINCAAYDNCDPNAPMGCATANSLGCGFLYSWSDNQNQMLDDYTYCI